MINNGFDSNTVGTGALELHAREIVNFPGVSEEYITHSLHAELLQGMVKQGVVSISKSKDPVTNSVMYDAKITVVPTGTKFHMVEHDCFKLKGEIFTEGDIIQALQIAFPERFL